MTGVIIHQISQPDQKVFFKAIAAALVKTKGWSLPYLVNN